MADAAVVSLCPVRHGLSCMESQTTVSTQVHREREMTSEIVVQAVDKRSMNERRGQDGTRVFSSESREPAPSDANSVTTARLLNLSRRSSKAPSNKGPDGPTGWSMPTERLQAF